MKRADEENIEKVENVYETIKKLFTETKYEEILEILRGINIKMLPKEYQWSFFEVKAMTLISVGRIKQGVDNLRQAVFSPEGMQLYSQRIIASNYCMYMHYLEGVSDRSMYEAHTLYDKLFLKNIAFSHEKKDKEKLRIGYLSPDLVTHIVLNFAIQLFACYNRERFEVYLYQVGGRHDEVSDWLMNMTDGWCELSGMDAYAAAQKIYDDGIDILFDLAGHTEGGATLHICAYKPAPVQLCGIGWFDTTGLSAMDYFLSDVYCDPPENDAMFTEKIIRLPHSHFCYTPPESVLKCKAKYQVHSQIVFGSFNNFAKITDEMLRIWKRLIQAVPDSKLLLKNVHPAAERIERMKKRLLAIGFRSDQIDIRPGSVNYLDEYMDMDIALDTYPYPGGGTTCEALYMGVPVVTRYGQRHGSRFGYSLLKNMGLGELTASSEEEYIRIAAALAGDRELLEGLHASLRTIMEKSPVMDARGYVRDVEAAYEKIWKEWLNS